MEWFKKTLTPQIREQNSEKEIQQAREEAKESGQASVFEYQEFSQTDGNEKLISGEKATEVCLKYLSYLVIICLTSNFY